MEYRSATLGTQLTEALADDTLADVTFIVGPERKVVKGLRIVIAARNKFFKSMLYESKMEDGQNESKLLLFSCPALPCPVPVLLPLLSSHFLLSTSDALQDLCKPRLSYQAHTPFPLT